MGLFDSVKTMASSKISSSISSKVDSSKLSSLSSLKSKAESLKLGTGLSNLKNTVESASSESLDSVSTEGNKRYVSDDTPRRTEYPTKRSGESITRLEPCLFIFEISGIEQAEFEECSGLEIENKMIEVREGGNNSGTVKLFDHKRISSNIILRKGITDNLDFFNWVKTFGMDAEHTVKENGSITIKTLDGLDIVSYNLIGVQPVKFTIPVINRKMSYPVEYLEISVDDILTDEQQ